MHIKILRTFASVILKIYVIEKYMDSVFELAWFATQQVLVTSDDRALDIQGFGSGFFLQYRNKLFFITADHVTHINDFKEGIRLGKDNYVWVFNNHNTKELATVLTPIRGLFSFDMIDIKDRLSFDIPDMQDVTFSILPNSFKIPFLTHELRDSDNNLVVAAGKEKIILKSECISELEEFDYCLIEGCVEWKITNDIRIERSNAIHLDLKFKDIDREGYYTLSYPNRIIYQHWAGLSGGPVFNDTCQLIGMIISVNETDNTIKVMPMKKITKLMDYAIKYENSIKELRLK